MIRFFSKLRRGLLLLILIAFVIGGYALSQSYLSNVKTNIAANYSPNEVLIQYQKKAKVDESSFPYVAKLETANLIDKNEAESGWYRAYLDINITVEKAIESIKEVEGVSYVQPNYLLPDNIFELNNVTNEESLDADDYLNQPFHDEIRLNQAKDHLQINGINRGGNSNIVVALVDTGVDYNHPYLSNHLWKNPEELNGTPGVDDDNNGIVDDIKGASFKAFSDRNSDAPITITNDPFDEIGHGTHVAGIIANIASNVQIMPVKIGNTFLDLARGIEYAINEGASIINISYGGYIPSHDFYGASELSRIVSVAENSNVLLVGAAGNDALPNNINYNLHYPSAYSTVLGVMYSDDDILNYYSNWDYQVGGVEYEIVAPGTNIVSTVPMNSQISEGKLFMKASGTSMATPVITGVAALVKSQFPNKTSQFIREQIIASPGNPIKFYNGETGRMFKQIDAYNALTTVNYTNVNMNNIPKIYFDPLTMDSPLVTPYTTFEGPRDFDPVTNTITFDSVTCRWSIPFNPNPGPYYSMVLQLGNTSLLFDSINGFYDYRSAYPDCWYYTSTLYNVTMEITETQWNNYVTYTNPDRPEPYAPEYTYSLNLYDLPISNFDPIQMTTANVFVRGTVKEYDHFNRTVTYESLIASWSIPFNSYPGPEYPMMVTILNEHLEFYSTNGYHDYRSVYPDCWYYTATIENVTIEFTEAEWSQYLNFVVKN